MGDIFPRPYVLLTPGGALWGTHGYQLLSQNGGVAQDQAYAVGAVGSQDESGATGMRSYVALGNPAAVTGDRKYIVARHDNALYNTKVCAVLRTIYPPYEDLDVAIPFAERRFPTSISYGATGGPGFKTSIFTVDSGIAHAHAEWDRLRARYEVEFDHVPGAEIEEVENFFYGMRGRAMGFRFKDWNDYQIVHQNVVVGDGVTTEFQLFKRYQSGGHTYDRIITKPVRNQIGTIDLDGEEKVLNRDFYFNYSSGVITWVEPPPAGSVGRLDYAEFDVPVRFDTDSLTVSAEDFNQFSISNLKMIEILV